MAASTPPPPPAPAASPLPATTTVFGYGSLLSEWSCRRTCPSCARHRLAALPGWRRVFSLVSVSQLRNGNADLEAGKIAALALSPAGCDPDPPITQTDNAPAAAAAAAAARKALPAARKALPALPGVVGCLFEIDTRSLPDLVRREHRYEMRTLPCYEMAEGGVGGVVPVDQDPVMAVVFVASTDQVYHEKCDAEDAAEARGRGGGGGAVAQPSSSSSSYHDIVGKYYKGSLWHRTDILPVDKYLHFCIKAAEDLGGALARDNFLDTSFLADGKTSVRAYLSLPAAFVRAKQHPPWAVGLNQDIVHHILSFAPGAAARAACVCRDWLHVVTSDPRHLFALLALQYKNDIPITRPSQVTELTAEERKGCAAGFDQLGATLRMIRARLRSMTACAAATGMAAPDREMLDILRAGLHDPHPAGGEGGEDAANADEENDSKRTLARRFVFYKWFLLCKQCVPRLYANPDQINNNPDDIFLSGALRHGEARYATAVIRCALDIGPRVDFASHLLSGFAHFTDEHGIVQSSPNLEDPTILRTAEHVHSPKILKVLKSFSEMDSISRQVSWAKEEFAADGHLVGGRDGLAFKRRIPICLTDLRNAAIADLQNRLERRWDRYLYSPSAVSDHQGFSDSKESVDVSWIEAAASLSGCAGGGAVAAGATSFSARAALHSLLGRNCTVLSFRQWNAGDQEHGVFLGMWAVQHWLVARDLGGSPEATAADVGLGDAWAKLGLNLLDIHHDGRFVTDGDVQPGRLRAAETALKAANQCYVRSPDRCLGRQARTLNDLGRLFQLISDTSDTKVSSDQFLDKCRSAHEKALELRTEVFGARSLPVSQSHLNLVDCYDDNTKEGRARRRYHSWASFSIRRELLPGAALQPLLNNARHRYLRALLEQWSKTRNASARSARELMRFFTFVATFEDGEPNAEEMDTYFAAVRARGGDVEE